MIAATMATADEVTRADRTPTESKLLATIIAGCALRGHAVHELAGGEFLISRWGMTRHCPGIAELEAFARQIGAAQ